MKALWQQQAARIDALSLRERVFLFFSVVAVCVALVDVLWLTPTIAAHAKMRQQFSAQEVDLQRLRAELAVLAQPVDANKAVREDMQATREQLEAVDKDIQAQVPLADSDRSLQAVLVQFLRRHEGLTLVSASTANAEAPAAEQDKDKAAPAGLTKRGFELRVAGPYAELVRYVKTLEGALPTLRWGALHLDSTKPRPELTLQVFVVGVQP